MEEDGSMSIDMDMGPAWMGIIINANDKWESKKKMLPRVPQLLKHNVHYESYFRPMVVSLGPYHHGHPDLCLAEELKPIIAKRLLAESTTTSINNIGLRFEQEIITKGVKRCYDDKYIERFDHDKFVRMMFLDACFVVYFINCCVKERPLHEEISGYKVFIQEDLLLLENQLPFDVLDVLISQLEEEKSKQMVAYIHQFMASTTGAVSPSTLELPPKTFGHLLELFRAHLIGPDAERAKDQLTNDQKGSVDFPTFRGAKELMEVGVIFRPSTTSSLRNIRFKGETLHGTLRLPPMTIDDSTKRKYLNLIAYEMCPQGPEDPEMMSYICFLDSLIDGADDVKHLRLAGILNNYMATDEDVASLFNNIATDLVPNLDTYAAIRGKIQKHINDKKKTWAAQFVSQHFRSPWTVIAFVGVVFTILVTMVEAWFTVFPRGGSEKRSPPSSSGSGRHYGMLG